MLSMDHWITIIFASYRVHEKILHQIIMWCSVGTGHWAHAQPAAGGRARVVCRAVCARAARGRRQFHTSTCTFLLQIGPHTRIYPTIITGRHKILQNSSRIISPFRIQMYVCTSTLITHGGESIRKSTEMISV